MKILSKIFSYLLLLYAVGMLIWGVLGFIEYLLGLVIIVPLQNPTFPAGTQFVHWTLITACGAIYLYGYFYKWKFTPYAMTTIFAMLATMCTIQTFDFMTEEWRYQSYVNEIIMYILISYYLFRSKLMRLHFGN